MPLLNTLKSRFIKFAAPLNTKLSYSQCGEDLIIDFIFMQYKKNKISYLDIGAHHPTYINNTAFFYNQGSSGICIEPDPYLFNKIKQARPRDICLNTGIGADKNTSADFYILSERTLNTFSKEEADRYVSYGKKIEKVIKIPLININDVIANYFTHSPDFISLDVEGYDFQIIKSFNFNKYRPKVWCVETLTYTENKTQQKLKETIEYMLSMGYFIYADTYINTIFVDEKTWSER